MGIPFSLSAGALSFLLSSLPFWFWLALALSGGRGGGGERPMKIPSDERRGVRKAETQSDETSSSHFLSV